MIASEAGEKVVLVGIHRGAEADMPRCAWVSDGEREFKISEAEYRARGLEPDFDALPVLAVQRVSVSPHDESEDDRIFTEEYLRKNPF
jgi:hypothetical protein